MAQGRAVSVFEFAYANGAEVMILPLGLKGVILQRCDRGAGQHDYQVVWWSDGTRKTDWLLPHELAAG